MKAEYSPVINWLLTALEPWVVYNTLLELIDAKPDRPEVKAAYKAMQTHPSVVALLESLEPWPPEKPLSRAYDPKDAIWKLNTLADFGMHRGDERISSIAEQVLVAQAEDGGFLHGGFDHTQSWHTRPYIGRPLHIRKRKQILERF